MKTDEEQKQIVQKKVRSALATLTDPGMKKRHARFDTALSRAEEKLCSNLDLQGHYGKEGDFWVPISELIARLIHMELFMCFLDAAPEVFDDDNKELDISKLLGKTLQGDYGDGCHKCGQRVNFKVVELNGQVGLQATTSCKYKKGFPEIKVSLKVLSGEILLFNDLREFYGEQPDTNVNTLAGEKEYAKEYAKRGLATMFIGNTCPEVSQMSRKCLMVGIKSLKGKKLGSICTDLWRYCAVDRAEFEKKAGKTVEQYMEEYHARGAWPEVIRAKVVPGVYEVTGRYHLCKDQNGIFSTIQLKRTY